MRPEGFTHDGVVSRHSRIAIRELIFQMRPLEGDEDNDNRWVHALDKERL